MGWLRVWLKRFAAFHNDRLALHYGQNHLHHFQIKVLAGIAWVFSLFLVLLTITFALIDSSLFSAETKAAFLPIKLTLAAVFALSYVALLHGRATLARRTVAVAVVVAVVSSVALTGGFPSSPAAPILLLPAIIFYCLYGARSGAVMAVLAPAAGLALYLAEKFIHLHLPNFTSPASPGLNVTLVILACHMVAVLVIASYERNNRLLSHLLDAELAKHTELANRDALTGLANARFFDLELKRQLALARAAPAGLALVYCDLDDFKLINDSHGQAVGDEVLNAIGKRLQSLTKHGVDTAARIGGDEFAVILVNCAKADIASVCTRIREAVSAPIVLNGLTFQVGVSVGHAYVAAGAHEASELIRHADTAMYQDKQRKSARQGLEALAAP